MLQYLSQSTGSLVSISNTDFWEDKGEEQEMFTLHFLGWAHYNVIYSVQCIIPWECPQSVAGVTDRSTTWEFYILICISSTFHSQSAGYMILNI